MNNIFDYKRYIQNIRYKEYVELVPLRRLWQLREFDRRSEPKWNQEESDSTIDELVAQIQANGFTSPVRIEFAYRYGTAIIAEGNHRLAAAIKLKLDYVPAIVYRHSYRNPKATRVMEPVKLNYVVPELLRPTDIGIEGCLTLDGKRAEPSMLEFYDDDDDSFVPFTDVMDNLVDVEKVFGGYEVVYNRSDKTDMEKLEKLFNSGQDCLYGEDNISYDSQYQFDGVEDKTWSTQYSLDTEKKGSILGKKFRDFLEKKLNTSKSSEFKEYLSWLEEENQEFRLAEMTDGQLLYAMQESEFDTLISVTKRVFYNIWKAWDVDKRIYNFYTDYAGLYNGYMNLEEVDNGVSLSIQRQELLQFKNIKSTDTSLKDILIREFDSVNFGFDGEVANNDYLYEDKNFDKSKIRTAFDKLSDMINKS